MATAGAEARVTRWRHVLIALAIVVVMPGAAQAQTTVEADRALPQRLNRGLPFLALDLLDGVRTVDDRRSWFTRRTVQQRFTLVPAIEGEDVLEYERTTTVDGRVTETDRMTLGTARLAYSTVHRLGGAADGSGLPVSFAMEARAGAFSLRSEEGVANFAAPEGVIPFSLWPVIVAAWPDDLPRSLHLGMVGMEQPQELVAARFDFGRRVVRAVPVAIGKRGCEPTAASGRVSFHTRPVEREVVRLRVTWRDETREYDVLARFPHVIVDETTACVELPAAFFEEYERRVRLAQDFLGEAEAHLVLGNHREVLNLVHRARETIPAPALSVPGDLVEDLVEQARALETGARSACRAEARGRPDKRCPKG